MAQMVRLATGMPILCLNAPSLRITLKALIDSSLEEAKYPLTSSSTISRLIPRGEATTGSLQAIYWISF